MDKAFGLIAEAFIHITVITWELVVPAEKLIFKNYGRIVDENEEK